MTLTDVHRWQVLCATFPAATHGSLCCQHCQGEEGKEGKVLSAPCLFIDPCCTASPLLSDESIRKDVWAKLNPESKPFPGAASQQGELLPSPLPAAALASSFILWVADFQPPGFTKPWFVDVCSSPTKAGLIARCGTGLLWWMPWWGTLTDTLIAKEDMWDVTP